MRKLNNPRIERLIQWVKDNAKRLNNFTDQDLEYPYLDKLSHQTKSPRIMRMISLAYYLGQIRGLRMCDEMFYTKITMRDGIENIDQEEKDIDRTVQFIQDKFIDNNSSK